MNVFIDLSKSRSQREYRVGDLIVVKDLMQKGYRYRLTQPVGKNFSSEFQPELTPRQMLEMGVFEGKYLNDCFREFPREWYETALKKRKLSPKKSNASVNFFQIKSRQPLRIWREKAWITPDDPDVRGWFQWYCRYYLGRRDSVLDARQIKRWKAFRRHKGQILKNCEKGNLFCRPKQRQALLQWAYDPRF